MTGREKINISLSVKICHHLPRGKQLSVESVEKEGNKKYTKLQCGMLENSDK